MPIIKLHRGSTNTMSTSPKKNIVLESGELFIEIPDNEVTEDNQYKFKVGDGSTTYENLPYAIDPTNISSNNNNEEDENNNKEEKYIEQDATLSGSTTTTVTFTDDSIKSKSITELVSNISGILYSSVNKSNGSCSFTFPAQGSNKTVSFRLYITTPYYKSKQLPNNNLGNATTADVLSGYTFTSANGIGLTGTAIVEFYRQLGETVTCNLSGSHTVSNYQCDVVYVGPVTYGDPTSGYQMCLLGNTNLASSGATWTTACNYTWTATFAAGQVDSTSKTINNIKIPTKDQIVNMCNTREYRSGRFSSSYYWTSTSNGSSNALVVINTGYVADIPQSYAYGVLPYIIIPL